MAESESLKDFLARVRAQDEAHGGIRHKPAGCGECEKGQNDG